MVKPDDSEKQRKYALSVVQCFVPKYNLYKKNKLIIKFAPYMLYCSGKHSIINMIPNAVNPISIKKLAIRFIH